LSAVSGFLSQALPAAQSTPELTPMLVEMLKFGVTAFKAGKGLEGLIDETADKFRQQQKAAEGQPKPPSPEMQKLQMEAQMEQAKMQAQSQLEQQKMQMQMELEKAKQEYQAQENQLKFQLEDQRNQREAESNAQLESMKIAAIEKKSELENNKEILVAYLNNANKIETARIGAGLDDGSSSYTTNVETAKLLQDIMGYDMVKHPLEPALQELQLHNQQLAQMIAALYEKIAQPKTIIRDENGRIAGVK
jgi:hypothetical protein